MEYQILRVTEEKGFTLIELMIVVAIIAVLAVIALTAFISFQAKTKQAEAKTNLAGIGTTAEAWVTEQNTYIATWQQLGWAPSGKVRYKYYYTAINSAGTRTSNGELTGTSEYVMEPCAPLDNTTGLTGNLVFLAGAVGQVDTDPTCDSWAYNRNRQWADTDGSNRGSAITDDVSS